MSDITPGGRSRGLGGICLILPQGEEVCMYIYIYIYIYIYRGLGGICLILPQGGKASLISP